MDQACLYFWTERLLRGLTVGFNVSRVGPNLYAADVLHHRYVKSGSGKVLYSILSSFPRMLGNQSDSRLGIYDYGSRCGSAFPYKLQTGCTWGSAGEDSFMWTHAFLLVYVQPLPSLPTTLRHDFLLVGPPGKDTCQEAMSRMLTLEELTGLTRSWLSRHMATKRELLSLIGKLSFAAKVVPAGRHLLRRLIDLSTTVRKLHHHISLNAEARADIRWWVSFLPSWNGVAMFLDPEWTAADSLQLYTDASGSLGFGAYFNGGPSTNPNPTSPARDLNHHLQLLLNRALAASTATTYATGIRRYQGFCHAFNPPQPDPELQDHSGLCGSSLIPALLHGRLEAAPLKRHDRRMLRVALTLGFFGFLRVSEFTLKNRRFDPRYHPTRQDISWTGEGMHFFIKRSKTSQMARAPLSALGVPRAGTRVQWQQWRPIEDAVAVPFSHHPSSTSEMGGRLHPRASAPPSYPWWSNVATIQPNTTHTVYVLVQPQQPPEEAFPLRPSRSLADGEVVHIRPTPVIP
eukprot:Em0007g184a